MIDKLRRLVGKKMIGAADLNLRRTAYAANCRGALPRICQNCGQVFFTV